MRKPTLPYLVVIQGIQNFSLKDTKFGRPTMGDLGQLTSPRSDPNAKYYVEYHATLRSNQQPDQGLFGFYGRTCSSNPKPLVPSPSDPNMLETASEDFIYFHTSFTEPSSILLIELVVVKESNRQIEKTSGGFAICNLFEFPATATAAVVQSGTPRMYGSVGGDIT